MPEQWHLTILTDLVFDKLFNFLKEGLGLDSDADLEYLTIAEKDEIITFLSQQGA